MSQLLILVALVFAIIELVRSQGKSFLCWAVVLIAVALALPVLRGF